MECSRDDPVYVTVCLTPEEYNYMLVFPKPEPGPLETSSVDRGSKKSDNCSPSDSEIKPLESTIGGHGRHIQCPDNFSYDQTRLYLPGEKVLHTKE
ncbi:hypothetical protein HDU76_000239 [Blyttiomyces sp. JEL0837]|nr:hypothetical protein HDU76_000239 [Blyttiomyces sp. JEL0837]